MPGQAGVKLTAVLQKAVVGGAKREKMSAYRHENDLRSLSTIADFKTFVTLNIAAEVILFNRNCPGSLYLQAFPVFTIISETRKTVLMVVHRG